MPGPFPRHQLLFVHRLAEALFDGFQQMAIPIEQVVENFQTQFALVGGTPVVKMRRALYLLNLTLGPDFVLRTIPARRRRIERCLRFGHFDFVQDLARLRSVVYGCYYGHWLGTDQSDNVKSSGRRQAYGSPRSTNPRASGDALWGLWDLAGCLSGQGRHGYQDRRCGRTALL